MAARSVDEKLAKLLSKPRSKNKWLNLEDTETSQAFAEVAAELADLSAEQIAARIQAKVANSRRNEWIRDRVALLVVGTVALLGGLVAGAFFVGNLVNPPKPSAVAIPPAATAAAAAKPPATSAPTAAAPTTAPTTAPAAAPTAAPAAAPTTAPAAAPTAAPAAAPTTAPAAAPTAAPAAAPSTPSTVEIQSSNERVVADGKSKTALKIAVRDQAGKLLNEGKVDLKVEPQGAGTFSTSSPPVKDGWADVTFTATAGFAGGPITITAKAGSAPPYSLPLQMPQPPAGLSIRLDPSGQTRTEDVTNVNLQFAVVNEGSGDVAGVKGHLRPPPGVTVVPSEFVEPGEKPAELGWTVKFDNVKKETTNRSLALKIPAQPSPRAPVVIDDYWLTDASGAVIRGTPITITVPATPIVQKTPTATTNPQASVVKIKKVGHLFATRKAAETDNTQGTIVVFQLPADLSLERLDDQNAPKVAVELWTAKLNVTTDDELKGSIKQDAFGKSILQVEPTGAASLQLFVGNQLPDGFSNEFAIVGQHGNSYKLRFIGWVKPGVLG